LKIDATAKRINRDDAPWCLVLGMFSQTSLSIVRSLGSHGVRVLGMCRKRHALARLSRYCTAFLTYGDEADLLGRLLALGRLLSEPIPVLVESDPLTLFMEQHKPELEGKFLYQWQEKVSLSAITNKATMQEMARQAGLAAPRSVLGKDIKTVKQANLQFPVFAKPIFNQGHKGFVANDNNELEMALGDELVAGGCLVQEIVPGPDENVYVVGCYSDRQGRILAAAAGRKRRQMPRYFGNAAYVESIDCPPIIELSQRFIGHVGYHGMADMEFKKSARSGEYIFIEANYRVCGFNELYVRQGLDLAYISYLELCGVDLTDHLPSSYRPARWMTLLDDLHTVLAFYRGDEGYTLGRWLRDLKQTNCFAVLSLRDPLPFALHTVKYLWRSMREALLKGRT
jgi:D-aspartate ligase